MNLPERNRPDCKFCKILSGELAAAIVFEDSQSVAFLDHRPLFPGHCLLIPKKHYETLFDLPSDQVREFFTEVQKIAIAVEQALNAEGTFVAINNRVSQSVPHLHVHIVPRRKGDGLKGFFWPRRQYHDAAEMARVQAAIRTALGQA
ncbi:MAG: HIT family protein [Acidobacteria bacterium]|nr:HIT family protein [Acidobacteriota bacterium]